MIETQEWVEAHIEDRQQERITVDSLISIHDRYGKKMTARVRDVSRRGAGIVTETQLPVGQLIISEVFLHGRVAKAALKVVWSGVQDDGGCEAGVEYVPVLPGTAFVWEGFWFSLLDQQRFNGFAHSMLEAS